MKRLACVALALGTACACSQRPPPAPWRESLYLACRDAAGGSHALCRCVNRKLASDAAPQDADIIDALEACLPPPTPPDPWKSHA